MFSNLIYEREYRTSTQTIFNCSVCYLYHRFPPPEAVMQNLEAHSSNHLPGPLHQYENNMVSTTNDSVKNPAPFQHLNGGGHPLGKTVFYLSFVFYFFQILCL